MEKIYKNTLILLAALAAVLISLIIITKIFKETSILKIFVEVAFLVLIGMLIYRYETVEKPAGATRPDMVQKNLKDRREHLEKIIKSEVNKGIKRPELIKRLKTHGYRNVEIEEVFIEIAVEKYKLHIPHENVDKLVKSVEKLRAHGIPDVKIKASLLKKGWPKQIVSEL